MAFSVNGQSLTNTSGDIIAKIDKDSIKALADGEVSDITAGDEILILDAESDETKRVTIAELATSGELVGSASVASLDDIGDVNASFPSNNDVLTYNSTTSEWEAQAPQTGSANPGGLQYTFSINTVTGAAANGEIRIDGSQTTFGINVNDRNGVSQANFFSAIATGLDYLIYIAFDGGAGYFQGTYTDNVANAFRFTSGSFTGVLPTNGDAVEVTITPAADVLNDVTETATKITIADNKDLDLGVNGNALSYDRSTADVTIGFNGDALSYDRSTGNVTIGRFGDVTIGINGNALSYDASTADVKIGFNGNALSYNRSTGVVTVNSDLTVTVGNVITGDGSGITNVSDIRWKTGISTIGIGMSFIEQLNPIKFQYQKPAAGIDTTNTEELTKWDYSEGWELRDESWRYGFSAQEVASIEASMGSQCGIACTENPEQYALRTEGLMPIMVNALKELQVRLDSLETENQSLRDRVNVLEGN